MKNEPNSIAQAIYHDGIVDRLDGSTSHQHAQELRRNSAVLYEIRDEMHERTTSVTHGDGPGTISVASGHKDQEAASPATGETYDHVMTVIEDVNPNADEAAIAEAATELDRAASAFEANKSVTMKKDLGGDDNEFVAGNAQLDTEGSAQLTGKGVSNDSGLPSERKLAGLIEHEVNVHEKQKEPDAREVQAVNQRITRTRFVEFAAISRQLRVDPDAWETMTPEYRGHYQSVLATGVSRERAEELSMNGKMLQFAAEANGEVDPELN